MKRRLVRSRSNVMIAGVCSGLGDYLAIDPTFVRIFFVLLVFANGIAVFAYLLLWVIIPPEDLNRESTLDEITQIGAKEIASQARLIGDDIRQVINHPHPQTVIFIGAALILLGIYILLQNLHVSWLRWLDAGVIWPVLLIFAGIVLVVRMLRGGT